MWKHVYAFLREMCKKEDNTPHQPPRAPSSLQSVSTRELPQVHRMGRHSKESVSTHLSGQSMLPNADVSIHFLLAWVAYRMASGQDCENTMGLFLKGTDTIALWMFLTHKGMWLRHVLKMLQSEWLYFRMTLFLRLIRRHKKNTQRHCAMQDKLYGYGCHKSLI